jgi:hypothetical protein
MKPFHQQYTECHDEGMHGKGEFIKYKEHPDMRPMPWSRAAKIIAEELKVNPEAGIQLVSCKRFGGNCTSGKAECRKLRGYTD